MKIGKQPRKQRKFMYNAPHHIKRKMIASHLAEDLMLKYKVRNIPVVRGDTVKIMRGNFKGETGKVRKVDVSKQKLEIEGITITKADGKAVSYPIHASNVMISKLNLTDPWRRRKLEERLPEEERKEVEKEAEEQIKEIEEEKAEEEKEEGEKEKETKEELKEVKEKEAKEKEKKAEKEIEEKEVGKEKVEEKAEEEEKTREEGEKEKEEEKEAGNGI